MGRITYKCTARTKERLLNAILSLVQERGYKQVTVRDICRTAGVSSGSFYYHYSSKEDLVKDAYLNIDRLLTDALLRQCNALPPREGLYRILLRHLDYVQSEVGLIIREYYRVMLQGENISVFDSSRPYYQAVHHQLQRCAEAGLLRSGNMDLDFLTGYTIRFLRGYITDWCFRQGAFSLSEHFQTNFDLFFDGI